MAIKIIREPDVHVTDGDLARYSKQFRQDYSYYSGPLPTFEEYVRRKEQQKRDLAALGEKP